MIGFHSLRTMFDLSKLNIKIKYKIDIKIKYKIDSQRSM